MENTRLTIGGAKLQNDLCLPDRHRDSRIAGPVAAPFFLPRACISMFKCKNRTVTLLAIIVALLPAAQSTSYPSLSDAKTESLLQHNTLFTVYGRAFNTAPILGRLGVYADMKAMAEYIKPWIDDIRKYNDGKGVVTGIHLIYAMATPCKPKDDCLLYLEGREKNLVENYIVPAAKRGWVVVLDTQLGKSNPVAQVKRMIDKGYLKYDNVHVAIDPEFHVYNDNPRPGIPIGTIQASQVNEVQCVLDDFVRDQKLTTKKILIVHQFGDANVNDGVPFMIQNKKSLRTFENVDLVIDMDGLGAPAIKVTKYNKITDSRVYPFIRFRGIKIFFPSRYERGGHFDKPPMSLEEIFGLKPVPGRARMKAKSDVIIIA
jgi:hypothetical protein